MTTASSSPSQDPHAFDADYTRWRADRIQEMDNDYRQWCQERSGEFSADFEQWRQRQAGSAEAHRLQPSSQLPGGAADDAVNPPGAVRHREGEATDDLPLTDTGASTHVGLATSHPEPLTR